MRLTNFEQTQDVSLSGLGRHWDLHNCCNFMGIELLSESGAVRLSWELIPEFDNQKPRAHGCSIKFDGVSAVWLTRVEAGSSAEDARTLEQMGLVVPKVETEPQALELGVRLPSTNGNGHYLFEFMGGFDIEIAAAEATLEAEFRT